jgi:hypothetical protein
MLIIAAQKECLFDDQATHRVYYEDDVYLSNLEEFAFFVLAKSHLKEQLLREIADIRNAFAGSWTKVGVVTEGENPRVANFNIVGQPEPGPEEFGSTIFAPCLLAMTAKSVDKYDIKWSA